MKSLLITLVCVFVLNSLYAQQHLFTLNELKQLVNCSDQDCFKKTVQSWGYRFSKQDSQVTDSTTFNAYFNRQMDPYRAESFVIQIDLGDYGGRRVMFSTNNKAYPTQLETEIQQGNFTLVGQSAPSEERTYLQTEDDQIWTLVRAKPSFSRVSENFIITLYSTPRPKNVSRPVITKPSTTETPHLGGEWDEKYPVQSAATLLKAERQYAANYEREHGKIGHTFERAEKVRIQGKRLGQYRPLTDKRWNDSFDSALRMTGFDGFANERTRLYQQEALFDIGGERIWVPIQQVLISALEKEANVGQPITLYAVLVSHHDFGGTLHLSFLVNEFAAAKALQTEPSKRETSTVTTVPKERLGCGFKWVDWSSISATDKAAMKKVMIPDYDGGFTGSLLQYITDELKQGNKIQIARHDFYEKKEPGYVVHIAYSKPMNGEIGRVEVYEDNGELYLFPHVSVKTNVCAIRPANDNKGIIFEDGRQEAFTGWIFFEQTYASFLKSSRQSVSATPNARASAPSGNRPGGKTPEELCLLLLKAIKTNNKALWMQCMSPDTEVEDDELSAKRFQWYRECLDQNGITDWASITFSRMTHLVRPSGGDRVDLDKIRSRIGLEFTYKNGEFVGKISFASFIKNDGLWQVRCGESGGYACSVHRSMR